MSRFLLGFSVILLTFGSVLAFMNTRADEVSSTIIDPAAQQATTTQMSPVVEQTTTTVSPVTNQSTTTSVNPVTNQTTSTTVDPSTDQTTTTVVDPAVNSAVSTTVNPVTSQTTVTSTNLSTGTSKTTITTPVPAPQETVAIPEGYSNCFVVAAGWNNDIWVPEHKVCQYVSSGDTTYQGSAWVDGYWHCNKYDTSVGACTNWDWIKGHWVTTFSVY